MGSIYGSVPKFNDVTDTLTTTGVAGTGADKLDNMSAIDIGTGPTDRNAQCVAVKSLYINFTVGVPQFADDSITHTLGQQVIPLVPWKVLIILDKQTNKAALTAALIWEAPGDFNSPLNLDNRKRIKVLKMFKGTMDLAKVTKVATGATAGTDMMIIRGTTNVQRKCWMKFKKPLKIEYDTAAVTGLVGDIVDNAISMWLVTDVWNTNYVIPRCFLYARTRFVSC